MHCSIFRLGTVVPVSLISLQFMERVVTMGTTRRSSVSWAFARSRRVSVRDGVCAWVVGFVGSVRRVIVVFITLFISSEVCVSSTIAGLLVGIACIGDVEIGGPLSSGAVRLDVSLIEEGIGECGRFGAFGLYFSFRLVGPSLLDPGDL